MSAKRTERVKSIDLLRGIVIILMVLDHTRDYFHDQAFIFDPTDISQTTPILFFTRFITHYCAPVFVFLAGTSAYIYGLKVGTKELSKWLLKRGIWLVIAELSILKLAWTFQLDYTNIILQVIWVIGVSMIFLAAFIHLSPKLCISICVLAIAGHNLLDSLTFDNHFNSFWVLLHQGGVISTTDSNIFIAYPMIPWIFVMPLGYHLGKLYRPEVDHLTRHSIILTIGIIATGLFFIIRTTNIYGDSIMWIESDDVWKMIMSYFNLSKYPPSLLYLLITLGPALILLSFAEKWKGYFFDTFVTIGRVPMFYYIIHIYVIHFLALIAAVLTGYHASDMIISVWINESAKLNGYGFNLYFVYIIWILMVVCLYPLTNWYHRYKSNHREYWWLNYL